MNKIKLSPNKFPKSCGPSSKIHLITQEKKWHVSRNNKKGSKNFKIRRLTAENYAHIARKGNLNKRHEKKGKHVPFSTPQPTTDTSWLIMGKSSFWE
jgi:hypothetical protein